MFGQYRAVFRAPGSLAFSAASFVMRVPIAMYPIGIVLIISARDGEYGFAGVLSACYVLGGALGMPVLSAAIDRFGQRRLILPSAAVHAGAVAALAVLVETRSPDAVLVAPALVLGFSYLSVGSLVRARWNHVLTDPADVSTAMSLESVLDELIFTVGPLVATLLATRIVPVSVLVVAVALVVAGSLWLAALRATEPPVARTRVPGAAHEQTSAPGDRESGLALRAPGMLLLILTTLPMGAVFASAEIASVAFAGQHGQRGLSGLALAAIAAASALSGVVYGARAHPSPLAVRFRRQALLFAALPFVLLLAVNLPLLVVVDFVLGIGIAPTLITAFSLAGELAPARSLTQGLTWVDTGLSVGYGIGSAVVGGIADRHGARAAFLVVIAAGLLVGAIGVLLARQLQASGGASAPRPVAAGWDDR